MQILFQDGGIVVCPLNREHRMPLKSLDRHLERCSLHKEGYNSDEEYLSSSDFLSSPSVVLGISNLSIPSNFASQFFFHSFDNCD